MPKRGIKLYLEDIRDAIQKINKYTEDMTSDVFIKDSKTVDVVVRNLAIIGEAAVSMPSEIRAQHEDIAWNEMIGMRNKTI